MTHYKDPYEPPLAPKIKIERPPWVPTYREYNGRPEWWAELGFKNMRLRNGIDEGIYSRIKEEDRSYLDPKVPDGTSLVGLFGLDTIYHKDPSKKADLPVNLVEYQKKIQENSRQYKNILKKWNISKEHPGIPVNPTLESIEKSNRENLGHMHMWNHWNIPYHYGPRFWDKPMNEGCFEKGLALLKYTTCGTLVWFFIQHFGDHRQMHYHITKYPGKFFKTWFSTYLPVPAALSMSFGVAVCTAASIRHKDDSWNWTIASIVAGATHTTMRNNTAIGVITALTGTLIGLCLQYTRKTPHGIQGLNPNMMFCGEFSPYTSPISWKHMTIGDLSENQVGVSTSAAHKFIL